MTNLTKFEKSKITKNVKLISVIKKSFLFILLQIANNDKFDITILIRFIPFIIFNCMKKKATFLYVKYQK